MKLRWKSFFVLLAASLIPLMVVTFFNHKASYKLSETVSMTTRQALTDAIRQEIIFATVNYAQITKGAKASMEFALQLLVEKAGSLFDYPPQGVESAEKVYFADDFNSPETSPPDVVRSEVHHILRADGLERHHAISRQHPSYLLAPGVDQTTVTTEIQMLQGMAGTMRLIGDELGDWAYWVYASVQSGVHLAWPGHGGYPAGYDPRQQEWYRRAEQDRTLEWSTPAVDSTTNQLIFTVSAPIHTRNGSFIGVSGIDVLLPTVLLEDMISSQWSSAMVSFLFGYHSVPGETMHGWVLRQQRDSGYPGAEVAEQIVVNEENEYFPLLKEIQEKSTGSMAAVYKGVDSFWAYAEIAPGLHFVIVAPQTMVTRLPDEVGKGFAQYTRALTVTSFIAAVTVLVVIGLAAFYLSKVNARNVTTIVNGFKRLEQGDFSARLKLNFNDERDLIVNTFNQIVPRLEEHLRMSRALGIAKEVQQSLLPNCDPELDGYDIAGDSIYCEETGGDYYDFIPLHGGKLAVVVGDVSGHGVSSALLMATARGLVMLRASMPGSAASIINDVNRHLSLDTSQTGNFMTFFYCEVGSGSNEIRWVRAGHDPALVYNPEKNDIGELKGRGVAFGLDPAFLYEQYHQDVAPGEIVLIGTDGIWEMRNTQGETYGRERLMQVIRENSRRSAKELVQIIICSLVTFRQGMRQEDDVTMVILKKR